MTVVLAFALGFARIVALLVTPLLDVLVFGVHQAETAA